MDRSLLHQVRHACRQVAEKARWMTIARERLPAYAARLPLAEALHPHIDPAHHYLSQGADTVAFFLPLDAVNFGSGYFPDLGLSPLRSGYFKMAAALADRFRRLGPFSAEQLRRLTPEDCLHLFELAPRNRAALELPGLFATSLNGLGRYLEEQFGGSFTALPEAAGRRAERLVEFLTAMSGFQDVANYRGLRVPFYKRAQLTVADLSIAFNGKGWGFFEDLNDLTLFADNLVPHVLRHDGILVYRRELATRIEAGQPLTAGSEEEIELRACAVHAVELLVSELHLQGHQVNAMGLDQWL